MNLVISVRFLDFLYHGLSANSEKPEWPPSPFRLFQALVAGSAHGSSLPASIVEALSWLESLEAPLILAPQGFPAQPVQSFVLNNTKGRSRTSKIARPTIMNDPPLIRYVWQFSDESKEKLAMAHAVASSATHIRVLGWGIDMAVGNGEVINALKSDGLRAVEYHPAGDASKRLEMRVPTKGSLESLQRNYAQYLGRFASEESTELESGGALYALQSYHIGTPRPHSVFKLVAPNGEDPARYPHAKLMHIAAMTRSLAIKSCQAAGYDPEFVSRFVRGKNEPARDDHKQISYVPLPSIGHEHSDAMIRNVMLVAPIGMDRELARVIRAIDGQELIPERDEGDDSCEAESVVPANYRAELQSFKPPNDKFIAKCYFASSRVWETVTPIILDEHVKKVDRRNEETGKVEKVLNHDELICLALKRAKIETPCRFIWQSIPFLKNCLSAHKYDREKKRTGYYRPKRLDGKTAVHVRITFEHPIPGPLALGAGRHCGFGLMAAVES